MLTNSTNLLARALFCFFVFVVFFLSCVPYQQPKISPEPLHKIVLTEDLIDEYKLTEGILKNVQFFLGSSLMLEEEAIKREKFVTAQHSLDLREHQTVDLIKFTPGTPGRMMGMDTVASLWGGEIEIYISFEKNSKSLSLTFSPDAKGRFRLENDSRGSAVKYGGKKYKCVEGCLYNYLHVAAKEVETVNVRTRDYRGWKYD